MMSDRDFAELELRAAICPHQIRWPKDALHWRKLHEAADEARERVTRAFAAMDEIDVKTHISRHAKNEQRQMIAAQAVADLEASRTIAMARNAVTLIMNCDDLSPEIAEATREAIKETEAGWQKAINKICERAALTKGVGMRRGATASA